MEYEVYLKRAEQAFKAFELLRQKKLREDAFSRGFYAVLHVTFALLIRYGQPLPKTYNGLVSKLWSLRGNLGLSESLIQTFSRMQALREGGDYEPVPMIEEADLDAIASLYQQMNAKVARG